ncbi:MAG: hypothetical protein ABI411_03220 [Tahibacter sp.]
MLLHPNGWRSGTQPADPRVILAIGVAITAFGAFVFLFRTRFVVDPANNLITREHRMIGVINASSHALSAFTAARILRVADSGRSGRYQLVLVAPHAKWVLESGATTTALEASRAVLLETLKLEAEPVDEEDSDEDDEDSDENADNS